MDLYEALFYRVVLRIRAEKEAPSVMEARAFVWQEARWLLATLPKILEGESPKVFQNLEGIRRLARLPKQPEKSGRKDRKKTAAKGRRKASAPGFSRAFLDGQ